MLDENSWLKLTPAQKQEELLACLNTLAAIEQGTHVLSRTKHRGKLVELRISCERKLHRIFEIESP